MLKKAKRKLAALLTVMLVISSMSTEAVMAAENDGLPTTNETTVITDDLMTDENVEIEESVPPEASETEENGTEENGTDVKPSEPTIPSESDGNEIVEDEADEAGEADEADVQETLMPDETGDGENVEATDSAEIAEMIYAQLTADDFETLVTKVEDAYMGMEEDSAGELDTEKLLSLIQSEVAGCLADILEKAKEDYVDLAKEDVYQEVYNSLYEKVLNNITELLGLNKEDNESNSSTYSLLPLTEKTLTPDLKGLTPVELTMVPFSRIFQGEDMTGVDQVAYVYHDSTYADDYEIGNYPGNVNLSRDTSDSYNSPWLMIPGGNQLNNAATRYIVKLQHTASKQWLVPSIYVQDDSGNRSEVVASSYEYQDYSPQSRYIRIEVPAWETSAKAYLKFDINKSLYSESNNRAVVKIYEGCYDTAEEAQLGNDITDKIYGNIDMTISNSGYPISGYYSDSEITIVTFDERGNVTGCLPLEFYLSPKGNSSRSNSISTGRLFKREGTTREYVNYTSRTQIEENIETETYELYDGYAVNDAYYLTMTYYQNGTSNRNAVTAAYVGTYTSIAEAANSGAADVKEALFGSDYNTAGYKADYSNGVYFTIFVGADGEGQEVYHYCIKTKAGIVPKSNSVGVHFTGLKDKDNKNVACYVVKPKDDSYGDGSYPTIIVADDVDLTQLAPVFYTDSGVNLYVAGGNAPEISGESYHDFSNGVVYYHVRRIA